MGWNVCSAYYSQRIKRKVDSIVTIAFDLLRFLQLPRAVKLVASYMLQERV